MSFNRSNHPNYRSGEDGAKRAQRIKELSACQEDENGIIKCPTRYTHGYTPFDKGQVAWALSL